MEIKDINVGNLDRITSNRLATGKYKDSAKTKTPAPREDDVSFSAKARAISQAGDVVKSTSAIRPEITEPIRAAVQSGQYNVGDLKVADSILRQVLRYRRNAL